MFRDSPEFEQANKLLGKMADRVLKKLRLQHEDIKDSPHYYPTTCSLVVPPGLFVGDKMEVSNIEFSVGKWDKSKTMSTYRYLTGESVLRMNFALPKTAEEFMALEDKITSVAEIFLK